MSSASPYPLQYDFKLKQTKSKTRKTSWVDPPQKWKKDNKKWQSKVHNLCPEGFWLKGRVRRHQLIPHSRGESSNLTLSMTGFESQAHPLISCATSGKLPHLSEHPFLIDKCRLKWYRTYRSGEGLGKRRAAPGWFSPLSF